MISSQRGQVQASVKKGQAGNQPDFEQADLPVQLQRMT
jgi:hypothetical protein